MNKETTKQYYLTAFENLENNGENTWNSAAFFFGAGWLCYRKMFMNCALLLYCEVVSFLVYVIFCICFPYGKSVIPVVFYSCILWEFLFRMFLGIFGNKLYYKELKRRIKTNSLFKGDLSEKNIRTELSKTMCTEETAQIDDKKQNESREKTTDEYYLTAFKNLENSGRNTWNWAAFFGGFLWFGYRKMFINCMLFLFCDVIFFAFCLAFSLLCALCQFGERFPPEIFCSYMILGCAIFRVPLGVFSNKIYYDRVKKNIREDHASLYSTIHAPFIWIRDRFLLRNTREKCTYPPFDFDSNEENIRAELRKTL